MAAKLDARSSRVGVLDLPWRCCVACAFRDVRRDSTDRVDLPFGVVQGELDRININRCWGSWWLAKRWASRSGGKLTKNTPAVPERLAQGTTTRVPKALKSAPLRKTPGNMGSTFACEVLLMIQRPTKLLNNSGSSKRSKNHLSALPTSAVRQAITIWGLGMAVSTCFTKRRFSSISFWTM